VAGATLAPSTLSLIRNMFLDPKQRTVAIAVWVTSFSVGGAIGPLAGGLLLEWFWWGSVFLLAVPVMALLLVLGPLLLPEYRDPAAGRLDLLSAGMSLAAVLLVIYGLKQFAQEGPGWRPALFVVAGVAVGAVFVRRQHTLADPLIDLRLFRSRAFTASLASYMGGLLVAFGAFLFVAQYLQLVLGMSPLQAGLWMLPEGFGFVAGSMLAPLLARRARPGLVMAAGLALAAVGFGLLTQVQTGSGLAVLVAGSLVLSLGLAPVITLATDLIVGAAPPQRAGAAAGISETGAEFGGALGIAVLGSIGIAIYRGQVTESVPAGVPSQAAAAAQDTLGGAVAAAGRLPGQLSAALLDAAQAAFTHALQVTAAISATLTLGMGILAVVVLRNVQAAAEPERPPEPRQGGPCAGKVGAVQAPGPHAPSRRNSRPTPRADAPREATTDE
jgi:MFS transporter, DHA2 family, multidrug resistance protein